MSPAFVTLTARTESHTQTYPAQLLNLRLAEVYEYLTNSHNFNKLVAWGKWMLQECEFTLCS